MRFGGCEVGGDVLVGGRDVSVARPVENGEVGRGKRVGNSGNEAGYSRFCCDYRRCSVGKLELCTVIAPSAEVVVRSRNWR